MDEAHADTDDSIRGRARAPSWKLRILLDANRWVVAGGIALFVFLGTVVAAVVTDGMALLTDGDPIETLFQAYVTAIVTGVTLVLTLNQLVLSQELGAAGDQRERMDGATTFRDDVADAVGVAVAPADPAQFLTALLEAADERAGDLSAAGPGGDGEVADHVQTLTEAVSSNAESASESLEGTTFGDFDVVSAALGFNYSWKLYAAKRLKAEHGDSLSDDAMDALDGLIELLTLFGPAREHVKTLYFQWELVDLSRAITYAAVPALLLTSVTLVFFDPTAALFAGSTFGVDNGLLAFSVAATVAVVPFAILLSYVLRVATVAKRTLSIGPFILRETDRSFDWEEA
ncbi:hypothetical protein [Haloarchaeobius sp. HRN-SO-5]|uniref:hypothetical protein n=1 Tax=Haloarchaeobius sp. HRN-SO-5 TaxID=3446118 RepID=UPI003EBAC71F